MNTVMRLKENCLIRMFGGGDSKTEFQVKSIILQEMGLNEDDYDTSVLKAAVTLFTNVVGVLNKVN